MEGCGPGLICCCLGNTLAEQFQFVPAADNKKMNMSTAHVGYGLGFGFGFASRIEVHGKNHRQPRGPVCLSGSRHPTSLSLSAMFVAQLTCRLCSAAQIRCASIRFDSVFLATL